MNLTTSNNPTNFLNLLSSSDSIDNNDDFSSNLSNTAYYDDTTYFTSFKKFKKNSFKVLSLNCGGIKGKFDEFSTFLNYYQSMGFKFEAICLQESGLDSFTNVLPFQLDGYQLIFQTKTASVKGGMIIYLSRDYTYKRIHLSSFTNSIWEFMAIEISHSSFKKPKVISNFYRPPHNSSHDTDIFLSEFQNMLSTFSKFSDITILGDHNIDLLKLDKSTLVKKFVDILFSLGYLPQITSPTRFTSHSATLIDNVFCKFSDSWERTKSGILTNRLSDHQSYFVHFPNDQSIKRKPKWVEYRKINDEGVKNLVEYLSNNQIFDSIYNSSKNVNENYNHLLSIISESRDKFLPIIKRRFNKYRDKLEPWMTNGILRSIRTRDKLHKKLILENINSRLYPYIEAQLRNHRIILRRLIFQAKQSYWENRFFAVRNNIKDTWRLINIAIKSKSKLESPNCFKINNEIITDNGEIANEFNNFFINIGDKLAAQIPSTVSHYSEYLKKDYAGNNFIFEKVSTTEVNKVINSLRNKQSQGYDGFSINLIKKVKDVIIAPLTHLINQSIETGIFPDSLKIARVLPIYKKGDHDLLDNYRPISILPALSKFFERILFNQLTNYLAKHQILFGSQYGFRNGHSAEHAAFELVERILSSFSNNDQSLAVYLDLTKAFDSMDHSILLAKLKHYGLSTDALTLISSYFENRTQYIDFQGAHSQYANIRTGVPQGSVLGPLFFILYVNDLNEASELFDMIMFADDTTLHCPLSKFYNNFTANTSELVTMELEKIFSWFCANKLTINASKTKFMIFHRPNSSIPKLSISINGETITQVTNLDFLGLTLDEHLSWSTHISRTCSKISSAIGMMRQTRSILPTKARKLIYHSLITSRINYMLTIWGGDFDRILKLQKNALRIIHGSTYNAHSDPLFMSSNILKIQDQYKINIFKLYQNMLTGKCPVFLKTNKILLREDIHSHDTRSKKLIQMPLIKLNYLRRTFSYRVGEVINGLPENIISKLSTHSTQNVMCRLKKSLINQYKSNCSGCYVCT